MSVKEKFDIKKHKLIISLTDSYKLGRHKEYPSGTKYVNEVLLVRDSNFEDTDIDEFVVFGTSYAKKKIEELFNDNFFSLDYESVEEAMKEFIKGHLPEGDKYGFDHWRSLHNLGKLPLEFTGVPEGSILPVGTPILEIINTHEEFFWLPNFIETIFLSYVWPCLVSVSRAYKITKIAIDLANKQDIDIDKYIDETLPFQFHDFSMRGQKGLDACEQTGMGHLCLFKGTDNLYAINSAKKYYNADKCDIIGASIPAVEHSSTTSNICYSGGGLEAERKYIVKLLTEIYPNMPVSYVCDSYDFWGVISDIIPNLKEFILGLPDNSKLVVRPDSGDPVDVLCGKGNLTKKNWKGISKHAEHNGLIRCLVDLFCEEKDGVKYLPDKVGMVYGDGMNYDRIRKILSFLVSRKVFIGSVVFGLGAVHQGFYTRDNLGIALKTTYINIDGNSIDVFKNPKTSSSINKRSPKGRVCVGYKYYENGTTKKIEWVDSLSNKELDEVIWSTNYERDLDEIRRSLSNGLKMYAKKKK